MMTTITDSKRATRLDPGQAARRAICGALTVGVFGCLPSLSLAAPSCRFISAAPVSFGVYDVLALAPNINGIGSITIDCQGGGNNTFVVSLSTGQSNSYASRVMKSGANWLNYNLYTSSGRTVIWGDGGGGSRTISINKNSTTTLSIFGNIPAAQDVAVGTYIDSIVASVQF